MRVKLYNKKKKKKEREKPAKMKNLPGAEWDGEKVTSTAQ